MSGGFLGRWVEKFRTPPSPPPESEPLSDSEKATGVFLEMFQGHDVPCHLRDGWIVADSGCLKAQAQIFPKSRGEHFSVQLDLEVCTPAGEQIVESCIGMGRFHNEAIREAIHNASNGFFHVILVALTGQSCSHCETEDWEINGRLRRVYVSFVVVRGEAHPLTPDWFESIQRHVKNMDLKDGMTWMRFFHADRPGSDSSVEEVLINNELAPDSIQYLSTFPWPAAKEYYSVRIFLIVMPCAGSELKGIT